MRLNGPACRLSLPGVPTTVNRTPRCVGTGGREHRSTRQKAVVGLAIASQAPAALDAHSPGSMANCGDTETAATVSGTDKRMVRSHPADCCPAAPIAFETIRLSASIANVAVSPQAPLRPRPPRAARPPPTQALRIAWRSRERSS